MYQNIYTDWTDSSIVNVADIFILGCFLYRSFTYLIILLYIIIYYYFYNILKSTNSYVIPFNMIRH